jgi:CBS domain-containing protein
MKIHDVMNINSIRILSGSTMAEAADLAAMSNASGLFVVDDKNNFIGVLSEGDMMQKTLPDMAEIMSSPGGLEDSGYLFSEKGSEIAGDIIDDHMIKKAVTLGPNDPLIKAASTMALKKMRRLPVVEDGKLVGTISRGDICKAVFKN